MSDSIVIDPPKNSINGVKPAVASKVESLLKKGVRRFGVSGAYMTHQAFDPAYTDVEGHNTKTAKEMLAGERDTSTFLKRWVKDKPGAVIVESVRVPQVKEGDRDPDTGIFEGFDLDCAVLFGNEIIMIDTMRWKAKKNYSLSDEGHALMTNKEFPGGAVKISEYVDNWLDYLDEDACLTCLVCINQEDVSVTRTRNWYTSNYRLVELSRFEELLNEKYDLIDDEDKNRISSTLVSQLVVRLQKPYDVYEKVFDMRSLRDFR